MKFNNKYISDLTSKDRNIALNAAKHIIDNKDIDAWNCLCESADNIFDFIKNNIRTHLSQTINEHNCNNLSAFFKTYSFDFDECLIQGLIKYAKEDLASRMLDLLQNGTDDEKAYSARYFSVVTNENANKYLFENYESEFEPLKYNVVRALANAKDNVSYNYYLDKLKEDDDWDKIDAAQFLQWYDNKDAFEPMLNAISTSTMPEHIASSVAMLDDISKYFNSANENLKKLSLDCYQHLINSLAEVLPLSNILDFDLYNCVETLITLVNSEENKSRYAALLLKTNYQMEIFYNNDEYKFNEDKNTIEAMEGILELFSEGGENFINYCKNLLGTELESDDKRIIFGVELIGLLSLNEYSSKLKEMLSKNYKEDVMFEIVNTLNTLNDFDNVDKNMVLSKINDFNIKSAVEQMFV